MKKAIIFSILSVTLLSFIYAEDTSVKKDNAGSGGFRIPDRSFEIGINAGVNFANNILSIKNYNFAQKTLEFEFDFPDTSDYSDAGDYLDAVIALFSDKFSGANLNLGLNLTPLYFSYNSSDGWGFGLYTGVDMIGILGLSGGISSIFGTPADKNADVTGAVFASVGLSGHFHMQKIKVKFGPSVFYPVAYVKPDGFKVGAPDVNTTTQALEIPYQLQIFTAMPMDKLLSNDYDISAFPGVDFNVGIEFPLSTGLDIGVDFINIPIVSSTLKDYMKMSGTVTIKEGDFDVVEDPIAYGKGEAKVSRPFKVMAWGSWRPIFGSPLFTLIPSVGFSLNKMYLEPLSLEAGLKARLDLANLFLLTAGVRYEDRLWINSVDMALNFRVFELDIGVDIRARDLMQSWKGYGAGAKIGLKFGW